MVAKEKNNQLENQSMIDNDHLGNINHEVFSINELINNLP